MANRDFNAWLSTMKDSIATWTYYTDFEKVYLNVKKYKVELNILNSLIGSMDIEEDFKYSTLFRDGGTAVGLLRRQACHVVGRRGHGH